jgi:hypothetical protein
MNDNCTNNVHSIADTVPIGSDNITDDEEVTREKIAENQYSEQHFAEGSLVTDEEYALNISLL